jgi:hypothetical protein
MAQAEEHLSSKWEALSLSSSIAKKKPKSKISHQSFYLNKLEKD